MPFARLIFRSISILIVSTQVHAVTAAEQARSYSVGVVPQYEQRKLLSIWRPILDELEVRTGLSFYLAGSPRIPVFESKFMAGKFDFAYMNPLQGLLADESQGYVPLVRDGDRQLTGILVVKKDSGIDKLEQLNGREIAFPSPNATAASLMLRRYKFMLVDLANRYQLCTGTG